MAMTSLIESESPTHPVQRSFSLTSRLPNARKRNELHMETAAHKHNVLSHIVSFWRRHLHVGSKRDSVTFLHEPQSQLQRQPEAPVQLPIYRPLGEGDIRLIRILPGSSNSTIRCELEHIAADDQVNYVALSYAWGRSDENEWIQLNGQDQLIRTSLASALRRLRDHLSRGTSGSRANIEDFRLWADALCLNQCDIDEKQRQVPRMGSVFSRAEDVYIWLGENASDTVYAIQQMMHAANSIDASMDKQSALDKLRTMHGDLSVIDRGVNALFRRRWFTRVWVIQEVALARRTPIMISGHLWSDADSLLRLLRVINPRPFKDVGAGNSLFLIIMTQRLNYTKYNRHGEVSQSDTQALAGRLKDALEFIGFFEASIPHDYLYSILGLCTAGDLPAELVPDYQLPFEEVCRKYTKFIIEADGDLSALKATHGCGPKVPSWVADFNNSMNRLGPVSYPQFLKFSNCGRKMTVLGRNIGRCIKVHTPVLKPAYLNIPDTSQDPYHAFRSFQEFLQAIADIHNLSLADLLDSWLLLTFKDVLRNEYMDDNVFEVGQHILSQTYSAQETNELAALNAAQHTHKPSVTAARCRPAEQEPPDVHRDKAYRQQLVGALLKAMEEEGPWPKEFQNLFIFELTHLSAALTENGMCALLFRYDASAQVGDIVVCGVDEHAGEAHLAVLLRPTGSMNEYQYLGLVQPDPQQLLRHYNMNRIQTAVRQEFVIV